MSNTNININYNYFDDYRSKELENDTITSNTTSQFKELYTNTNYTNHKNCANSATRVQQQQFVKDVTKPFTYYTVAENETYYNPDKNDLFVKDRRLVNADYYFVKPLSPPGSEIKITGIISVQIKNTFLLGTGNSELTQFNLKMRDRAGNWSNSINTPNITITK